MLEQFSFMGRYKMTISRWHKKIYDAETGVETIIEYTPAEIVVAEAAEAAFLAKLEILKAEQAVKDAAKQAVLDKLGLSADEVAALLG